MPLFLVSIITGVALLLLFSTTRSDDVHIDHFGSTLSTALATQVVDPLGAEDLMHLGVLANRITELPEVIGATVHTVDGKMLASSGDVQRGRPFTQGVVVDDTIVGYVRLHVDSSLFGEAVPTPLIVLSLMLVLGVPAGVLLVMRWHSGHRAYHEARESSAERLEPATERPHYLVVVNLFNQLSLPPEQCKQELAFAMELAEVLASSHQADVVELSGTGLLLSFDDTSSDDRPFHVVCAASVLSQLLREADSRGRYRISAHRILKSDAEPLDLGSDQVADAAILSALAKDNTLAVSAAFYAAVPYPQRLMGEAMNNPLLGELESIDGGAYLVIGLAAPHQELVMEQVRELSYPGPSTASESTF